MIRKFSLKNEYGREYPLSLKKAFLADPEGLGYSMDASYMRIGSSFARNYYRDDQGAIKGTVVFTGRDCYLSAADFLKFIRTSAALTLIYTTDAGTYMRDVDMLEFDKTEIGKDGALKCDIKLAAKSLWYSDRVQRFSIDLSSQEGTRYPYKWGSRFRAVTGESVDIVNDGSAPAPIVVELLGSIVNPKIICSVDKQEIARLEITGEAAAGEKICYSSVDGDLYCYVLTEEGEKRSLLSGLSIENDNFFKLPVGTSTLTFEAETQITKPIVLQIRKLYRAV